MCFPWFSLCTQTPSPACLLLFLLADALLGAASFLGGSMRMTVSTCIMLLELTNNLALLPLVMLVLAVAKVCVYVLGGGGAKGICVYLCVFVCICMACLKTCPVVCRRWLARDKSLSTKFMCKGFSCVRLCYMCLCIPVCIRSL